MNRWSKSGAMDRVFEKLQLEQIVRIRIEAFRLDSTSVKVHPDGTGALKKTDRKPSANLAAEGPPIFIWVPSMREPQYPLHFPRAILMMRRRGANCIATWDLSQACR